jgi:hypothetical protein
MRRLFVIHRVFPGKFLMHAGRKTSKKNSSVPRGAAELQLAWLKWGFAGGLLLVVLAVIALLLLRGRTSGLPPLTRDVLRLAEQRWRKNQLQDYTIEIRVTGAQPATYLVEVRDGVAVSAKRNGHPLAQSRVFGTWSVPGMFDTLASDVARLEDPTTHSRIVARCLFNETYGYPARYDRQELDHGLQVAWEVTKFETE